MKESILIANSQKGDTQSFSELVSLYQRRIYDLAYRITHSHTDSEDIAQEVFIRLWRKIHKFKGESSFFTWLYRMVINVSKNYLRSRPTNQVLFEEATIGQGLMSKRKNPAEELIFQETSKVVTKAIDTLPFKHRMVVLLHDIEGFSHKEISRIMRC